MALKINENLTIALYKIEGGQLNYEFTADFNELSGESDSRFSNHIKVKAKVEKTGKDYLIWIEVYTTARLICDRCGEEFNKKITEKITVLSSFKKHRGDCGENENVKLLQNNARVISITQEVLDLLLLSIPQKILCKKDCKGLCSKCGVNLNQTTCQCKKNYTDPRWEKLKNIDFHD